LIGRFSIVVGLFVMAGAIVWFAWRWRMIEGATLAM